MLKSSFVFLVLASVVLFVHAKPSVLFIGNSYTFFNDLPMMFDNVTDHMYDVQSHTVGGESLCGHSKNATVIKLLQQKWDYVILQDFSEAPSQKDYRARTIECLRNFYKPALIKTGSVNVVLYLTWGRRDGDKPIGFPDYLSMQDATTEGYQAYQKFLMADGSPLLVQLSPVGLTYRYIHEHEEHPLDHSSLFWRLYVEDGSHPTPIGSYIGACSFYMRIVGKSPVGIQFYPKGVTLEERDNIQKWVSQFQ